MNRLEHAERLRGRRAARAQRGKNVRQVQAPRPATEAITIAVFTSRPTVVPQELQALAHLAHERHRLLPSGRLP